MTDKEIMAMLANAVKIGMKFLPDGEYYQNDWVWEACTSEEEEEVKNARDKMNAAYLAYSRHIK